MAQVNGYVPVLHQTFDQWIQNTRGNGYNVDFSAGNQCWDYCALLYWQYMLNLVTKPGGGVAKECWTRSREANSKRPFISIEGVENIKRGDIIVLDSATPGGTGHICFADENYRTLGNRNLLWTWGQTPSMHGINGVVSRDELIITRFLGIFRNTLWDSTPGPGPGPEPEPSGAISKKDKFPWPVAWYNWSSFM